MCHTDTMWRRYNIKGASFISADCKPRWPQLHRSGWTLTRPWTNCHLQFRWHGAAALLWKRTRKIIIRRLLKCLVLDGAGSLALPQTSIKWFIWTGEACLRFWKPLVCKSLLVGGTVIEGCLFFSPLGVSSSWTGRRDQRGQCLTWQFYQLC